MGQENSTNFKNESDEEILEYSMNAAQKEREKRRRRRLAKRIARKKKEERKALAKAEKATLDDESDSEEDYEDDFEDPCEGVECEPGEKCVDGDCEVDYSQDSFEPDNTRIGGDLIPIASDKEITQPMGCFHDDNCPPEKPKCFNGTCVKEGWSDSDTNMESDEDAELGNDDTIVQPFTDTQLSQDFEIVSEQQLQGSEEGDDSEEDFESDSEQEPEVDGEEESEEDDSEQEPQGSGEGDQEVESDSEQKLKLYVETQELVTKVSKAMYNSTHEHLRLDAGKGDYYYFNQLIVDAIIELMMEDQSQLKGFVRDLLSSNFDQVLVLDNGKQLRYMNPPGSSYQLYLSSFLDNIEIHFDDLMIESKYGKKQEQKTSLSDSMEELLNEADATVIDSELLPVQDRESEESEQKLLDADTEELFNDADDTDIVIQLPPSEEEDESEDESEDEDEDMAQFVQQLTQDIEEDEQTIDKQTSNETFKKAIETAINEDKPNPFEPTKIDSRVSEEPEYGSSDDQLDRRFEQVLSSQSEQDQDELVDRYNTLQLDNGSKQLFVERLEQESDEMRLGSVEQQTSLESIGDDEMMRSMDAKASLESEGDEVLIGSVEPDFGQKAEEQVSSIDLGLNSSSVREMESKEQAEDIEMQMIQILQEMRDAKGRNDMKQMEELRKMYLEKLEQRNMLLELSNDPKCKELDLDECAANQNCKYVVGKKNEYCRTVVNKSRRKSKKRRCARGVKKTSPRKGTCKRKPGRKSARKTRRCARGVKKTPPRKGSCRRKPGRKSSK